jgi:predicted nucleic acid-binding protein
VITAVDTNILLDILIPGEPHYAKTERALLAASRSGDLVISEAVYAELGGRFGNRDLLEAFLGSAGTRLQHASEAALLAAGFAWRKYSQNRPEGIVCPRCGEVQAVSCPKCGNQVRSRQHIVADFMIGAHALHHADGLLTRDRGFYKANFPELRLV